MNNLQNRTMMVFFSSNQDFQISNVDLHNLTWFQGHSFAIFLQLRNISQANGLMSIKFLHNLTSMLYVLKSDTLRNELKPVSTVLCTIKFDLL